MKLIGYCCEDDHRLLVYEFMFRGSLENHLFRSMHHPFLIIASKAFLVVLVNILLLFFLASIVHYKTSEAIVALPTIIITRLSVSTAGTSSRSNIL